MGTRERTAREWGSRRLCWSILSTRCGALAFALSPDSPNLRSVGRGSCGRAGWGGWVLKRKEGARGKSRGQTEMVKGNNRASSTFTGDQRTHAFHPRAERASPRQEANCAVTLSLSVQSTWSCQQRQEASPAGGNPQAAPGSSPSPREEPGPGTLARGTWRNATGSLYCHLRNDEHILNLHLPVKSEL